MKQRESASQIAKMSLSMVLLTTILTGCSDDDSSVEGAGYLMIYNAAQYSPELNIEISQENLSSYTTGIDFAEIAGTYSMDAGSYDLDININLSVEEETTLYQGNTSIADEHNNLVVVTGDIQTPEILEFQYPYEDPETEDGVFAIRVLNLIESTSSINILLGLSSQSFEDAVMISQLNFAELTDSQYFDVENYTVYLTDETGNLLFESDEMPLLYTNQQLLTIRKVADSDNQYEVDRITSSGSVITYRSIDIDPEVRFFNAMDRNDLLPAYDETVDVQLANKDDSPMIDGLNRHQHSDIINLVPGDYRLDILEPTSEDKLTHSQILSLPSGSDKTVFFYLTEVTEEDDDDSEAEETTELFVNTLVAENNATESYYEHEVQIVNFSEDYPSISVYFVPSQETISTTDYLAYGLYASPNKISLANGSYDVFILAQEGNSEILLANTHLELTENSKNLYFVFEQEDKDIDEFIISTFNQN